MMKLPSLKGVARGAPRNADFGTLQETFLVTAVATVLIIRTELWLTNYPQLGGAGLHIAHLLYGGILMMLAIGILLTYLGRGPRLPAALVGGIGFGFFIDELGKFITSDNDYFFKPAAALIYVVFVGLFLLAHRLRERSGLDEGEAVANALDLVVEGTRRQLYETDRERALAWLDRARPGDPYVAPIRRLLAELETVEPPPPRPWQRLAARVRAGYLRIVLTRRFRRGLTLLFVGWAVLSTLSLLGAVLSTGIEIGDPRAGFADDDLVDLNPINVASLVTGTISVVFVVLGLYRLRTRRGDAYKMFERALLVSIVFTRPFSFVESQFTATFGVALDILLLLTVRAMMAADRHDQPVLGGAKPEPAGARQPVSSGAVA